MFHIRGSCETSIPHSLHAAFPSPAHYWDSVLMGELKGKLETVLALLQKSA